MTSGEFKEARGRLGFSLSQMETVLDVDARTIRRWEAGEEVPSRRDPNPVACRVLSWLPSGELQLRDDPRRGRSGHAGAAGREGGTR